jgi:glycine oxidase
MDDVVIVGAGVMGCASALALAQRGVSTRVLERSVPGAEASSAAAGILGAQIEPHGDGPMARLCLASRTRFAGFARELHEQTGIDVQFRACGVSRVAYDLATAKKAQEDVAWQPVVGLTLENLDAAGARAAEPALCDAVVGGVRFPEDARIDPPAFLKALRVAAERAGARFQTGAYVRRVLVDGGRARGVALEDGSELLAGQVVLAAGSWSTLVGGTSLPDDAVTPARGQIVELLLPTPILRGVVFGPGCYLVPRDDGRVLIGSTLEFVGYRRAVTAKAVRDLVGAALTLVPALGEAELGRAWSSFRPYTKDELPLLGPSSIDGLLLATGHYRNGVLLSAITAEIIAAAATGAALPEDIAPFASGRLTR